MGVSAAIGAMALVAGTTAYSMNNMPKPDVKAPEPPPSTELATNSAEEEAKVAAEKRRGAFQKS